MPRERPIPFLPAMVRAILEGTKTQTRRLLKPQPKLIPPGSWMGREGKHWWACHDARSMVEIEDELQGIDKSMAWCLNPYGKPGDRLWVREPWRAPHVLDHLSPKGIADACLNAGYNTPWCPIQYESCGTRNSAKDWHEFGASPGYAKPGRYRHARFMPRWASRLTLEVTGVRIERLQAISESDCIAEGIERFAAVGGNAWQDYSGGSGFSVRDQHSTRGSFRSLWNSTGGDWDANPWVWVVEFKRVDNSAGRGEGLWKSSSAAASTTSTSA